MSPAQPIRSAHVGTMVSRCSVRPSVVAPSTRRPRSVARALTGKKVGSEGGANDAGNGLPVSSHEDEERARLENTNAFEELVALSRRQSVNRPQKVSERLQHSEAIHSARFVNECHFPEPIAFDHCCTPCLYILVSMRCFGVFHPLIC